MKREEFLQITGMSVMGASVLPSAVLNTLNAMKQLTPPAKIGLQLYTLRKEIEKDIRSTLKKVAYMGYEAVETAFWPKDITLKKAAAYLKEAGLPVSSAHIEIPVGEYKIKMLETAEAFGCKKMIWHGWPEDKRYSTPDGTKQLAEIYNEANYFAKANGLQFGLHNHWWEFRNKVGDRFVYEVLLELAEPDIFFEIDTYWVKVAGHNPADIVKKFGKRAPLLHIKDGPAKWNDKLPEDNPDPMTAVGKGTQNFPAIVNAANGCTEWMIVEMDKTETDVFIALQESYNYLTKNKLAKGRK
jgi:sugar phosphate isomerase/epimerase